MSMSTMTEARITTIFGAVARHFEQSTPIRPLGVRSEGAIAASAARPFASFGDYERYAGDFEKAAALMHALIQWHPFMNGNKRVAVVATFSWLISSGYSFAETASDDEVVRMAVQIASGREGAASGSDDSDREMQQLIAWLQGMFSPDAGGQLSDNEATAVVIGRFRAALQTLADY